MARSLLFVSALLFVVPFFVLASEDHVAADDLPHLDTIRVETGDVTEIEGKLALSKDGTAVITESARSEYYPPKKCTCDKYKCAKKECKKYECVKKGCLKHKKVKYCKKEGCLEYKQKCRCKGFGYGPLEGHEPKGHGKDWYGSHPPCFQKECPCFNKKCTNTCVKHGCVEYGYKWVCDKYGCLEEKCVKEECVKYECEKYKCVYHEW